MGDLNEWHLRRSVLDVDHPVHGLFRLEGVDELEKRIVIGLQNQADRFYEEDGALVDKDRGYRIPLDESGLGDLPRSGEEDVVTNDAKKKMISRAEEFTIQVQ